MIKKAAYFDRNIPDPIELEHFIRIARNVA